MRNVSKESCFLESMFEDAIATADLKIWVGKGTILAHKSVLFTRGGFLSEAFGEGLEYKEEITDNMEAVRIVIKFLYTQSTHSCLSYDNVFDVFRLSVKYIMDDSLPPLSLGQSIRHPKKSSRCNYWKPSSQRVHCFV
jgi:hypothetical protein